MINKIKDLITRFNTKEETTEESSSNLLDNACAALLVEIAFADKDFDETEKAHETERAEEADEAKDLVVMKKQQMLMKLKRLMTLRPSHDHFRLWKHLRITATDPQQLLL